MVFCISRGSWSSIQNGEFGIETLVEFVSFFLLIKYWDFGGHLMGFWHCVFILCEVISLSPYPCIVIWLLCLLNTNNLVLRILINLHWVFVSSRIASSRISRHLIPSPYKCFIINIFCFQGCKRFRIFLAFSNKLQKISWLHWLLQSGSTFLQVLSYRFAFQVVQVFSIYLHF